MTSKAFPTLANSASKADEVEHLVKFAESLGQGTYLASLINPRLIEWFQHQIKDDLNTDVLEVLQLASEELARAQADTAKALSKVDTAERALAAEKADRAKSEAALREKLDYVRRNANGAWEIVDEKRREIADLQETCDNMAETIKARDDEIVRLKAKLYDLIVAEQR